MRRIDEVMTIGKNGKAIPIELLEMALAGEYEVTSLDVHEFPLFLAFAAPSGDGVTGLKPRLPSGRGLTKAEALTGAAAEAIELRASLAQKITEGRFVFTNVDGRDHLTLASLFGSHRQTFAAQEVFLDYAAHFGEQLVKDSDSTGCATAQTLAGARQRGLLECIERDGVATWWYGKLARPHLPLAILDQTAPRISWWLSRRSRTTMLIDLTTDVAVPCVAAVSCDGNGLNVAIGSSAALSTAQAALSAVLEMLQTEVSMQLGSSSLNRDLANWQRLASTKTMPQFVAAVEVGKPFSVRNNDLYAAVNDAGFIAYGVELTLPDDPLMTVRVLVPGFSSLNRVINKERIAKARGRPHLGDERYELLEPY